jgi:hypothetical protein
MGWGMALRAWVALLSDDYVAAFDCAETSINIALTPYDRELAKARGAAEKAFVNARSRGLIGFDELLAATARFAEWANSEDAHFIKHPATWLNADSYLNEPDAPRGAAHEAAITEPSVGPQSFSEEDWKDRLHNNWAKGEWSSHWGPRPGDIGCRVPAHLLNGRAHG